jgi:hypothetical protein
VKLRVLLGFFHKLPPESPRQDTYHLVGGSHPGVTYAHSSELRATVTIETWMMSSVTAASYFRKYNDRFDPI